MTGFKEWVFIAWIGTTSNFVVLDSHVSRPLCESALQTWREQNSVTPGLHLQCVQDFREGRSQYPDRPGSQGIASPK
jgi:hypothetical protein